MTTTTVQPQAPITPRKLNASHITHLTDEGFPPEQIDKCHEEGEIFSISEDEARSMGFKIWDAESKKWKSGSGLYMKFTDEFGQLRLDTPIEVRDKNGKTRTSKYLTPHKVKSVPMMPEGAQVWTEGWKDAQIGSILGGIPTAAAAGISHYKIFPEGGGLITIADSDAWHNPDVFGWLFSSGLHQRGKCAVAPSPPEDKAGLVEFFNTGNGAKEYREFLDGAVTPKQLLLEWPQHWKGAPPDQVVAMARKAVRLAANHLSRDEQIALVNSIASASQFSRKQVEQMLAEELDRINAKSSEEDDQPKKDNPPIASKMAGEIAEEYRDKLAYDDKSGRWFEYGLDNVGMWSAVSKEYVQSAIAAILEGKGYSFGSGYLNDVLVLTRNKLLIRKWDERSAKEFLPFENGVLEIATGKLLDHAPGYRFTWQLPRRHNILAINWDDISQFLDEATGGNKALRNILIGYANALLKGRSDLQKFLFLIGRGGTGKGTLMRLLSALIGSNNIHSSTLEDFCGNQFESANAYQKRGVFFWDEDRKVGKLGKLKALTGGDWIRGEEKGMKAFQFQFDGMVAIAANFPIFTGDSSSGLSRRIITVPMNQRPAKRKNLEKLFEGELDAFTNYLLGLDDDFVTRVLLGEETVPAVEYEYWENRQRTDSIAAWLNDWVIANPDSDTPVGNRKDEATSQYEATTLYGSYCLYCHQNGFSTKSSKNFSPDLLELCTSILGWQVSKARTKTGKYLHGLRLRSHQDLDIPTYDYTLHQRTQVTGDGSGAGSMPGKMPGRVPGQDAQPESVIENSPSLVTGKSELGEEKKEKKLELNSFEEEKNISLLKENSSFTRHLSTEIAQMSSQQEVQPGTSPGTSPGIDPAPDSSPPTESVRGNSPPFQGWVWVRDRKDWYPAASVRSEVVDVILDSRRVEMVIAHGSDEFTWGHIKPTNPPKSAGLESIDCQTVENQPKSKPTVEQLEEPDYSEFPWEPKNGWQPGAERDRSREQRAEKLREALLAVSSQQDFDALSREWSGDAIAWVDANLLTPEQVASRRNLLESIANSKQQSLDL